MKRTTLFSLLVIGVAIGIAYSGSTFSLWTDSSTGSTAVATQDLDLLVDGDGNITNDADDGSGQDVGFVFTFALDEGCEPTALLPGVVCSRELTITNGGDVPFTWEAFAWSDGDGEDTDLNGPTGDDVGNSCFNVAFGDTVTYEDLDAIDDDSEATEAPAAGSYPGANTDALEASESMTLQVNAAVADDNDCQSLTGDFIVVTILATQYTP